MKVCTKCGEDRMLSEFSVRRASPDGLAYKCKHCDSLARKANRAANLEHQLETIRRWARENHERKKQIDRELYAKDCASGKRQSYRKRVYEENKKEILAKQKFYRDANKELVSQRKFIARIKNPERTKELKRLEYERNKHKYLASAAKRRAVELQATPSWADKEAILRIYEECQRISQETGIPHEVDHDIPLISKLVCGLHVEHNLKVLTMVENRRKNNKFKII